LNSKKLIVRIVENWPAKVISVAIALILFVFNRMNTLGIRSLSVPLTVETGDTLIPASSYPENVRIRMRGEDDGIKSVIESDIEAYIDLSKRETEGWYRAPVQIRKKGSALGVGPLETTVTPMEISILLDLKISKTVPLVAVIQGKAASGFDLVHQSISPAEIMVTGPRGAIESLAELYTDPIDMDGRNADFGAVVNIINPNPLFIIRGNGMAEFQGQIRQSVPVRNFDGISVILEKLDPRFEAELNIKTGMARLEGNQGLLDAFKPPPHFFSVDCSSLTAPGDYDLPVIIDLPRGFSLVRREPESVSLTLTLKEEEKEEEGEMPFSE
jgi:YbbR domain-containing protein